MTGGGARRRRQALRDNPGCAHCRLSLTNQIKVVLPKTDPQKPSKVLCIDCFDDQREKPVDG